MALTLKVRIGIVAILVSVVFFTLLQTHMRPGNGTSLVRARLTDVRALPEGAPVTIAGLRVGSIVERRVGSGYAEIDIEFTSKIDLRKDATLYKRRISLLSGPSLEIDPGASQEKLPGRYIERVVETSQIGDVLYEISEALPGLQAKASEGMLRAEQMRARVNGPFQDRVLEFDDATQDIARRMRNRLGKMDEALQKGEAIHFDPRGSIEPVFDRAEELTTTARDGMSDARGWVVRNAAQARQSVDDTKIDWSEFSGPISDIDDGKGTLGTLLNDGELHDDIVEITNDTRSFVRSVANWQMQVGLKTEFGLNAREPVGYVTIKAGRTDRFYYIELVGSPRGGFPEASTTYDSANDTWDRNINISNSLRLTAQYANRLGPMFVRFGFKESSFGVGADLGLIDDRLRLSADVFELGVNDLPRVKLAASLRLFGQLYVLAGLDDALNPGQTITTPGVNGTGTLSEVYLGRDLYLGAGLEFSVRDLAILMRLGGAILGNVVR